MRFIYMGALGCALALQFPPAEAAQKYKVVHSFGSATDGVAPEASLINVQGILYGTTYEGGTYGSGTVFSLDPSTGKEKVLYSFCRKANCADGEYPSANLIDKAGTLYGTTSGGGSTGIPYAGTVFALDRGTRKETVLYSFCMEKNCADGALPVAGLIVMNGMLYGTTAEGGAFCGDEYGCGAVFALDPSTREETVIYSFCAKKNCTDGADPQASLIAVNGTLYGTTVGGGTRGYDEGTVFTLDPGTGKEAVIHSFCRKQNCTDGSEPWGDLIGIKGTLYGTTVAGGTYNGGTVFSLDLNSGAERAAYSFCSQSNCTDGEMPYFAGLIEEKRALYGTTNLGGTNNLGTIFSVDSKTGAETVLYSFCIKKNCADGSHPGASLIDVKGTLYGTTRGGGTYDAGAVFALKRS